MKRRLRPMAVMLSLSKHLAFVVLIAVTAFSATVRAETETIDLKALAKKARPAVMLLVVSDAAGKEIATGTGFLVSSDGKLITNHHVIEGAANAVAKAENGGLFPIEGVLADDPKNDLVLLKLKGKDLPFLTLGDSDKIEVGTRIAVIGSPLGLEGTLSEGIVSANRDFTGDMRLLQLTAAISPGSSGSPVINNEGYVIGVAAALLRGGQALNFAVPAECAVRLMTKAATAMKTKPLGVGSAVGEDAIYSDPDWRAAYIATMSGDDVENLKYSKALVDRFPENAEAWFRLGYAFGHLNFTDDAISAYRQAIKIKPESAEAWCNLGNAYSNSRRTDDAIAAYREAIKIKPDHANAWYCLGYVYMFEMPKQAGRTHEAIAAFLRAIKIKPDFAKAWLQLGTAYYRAARIDDAIAACQEAVKIEPNLADAWISLGLTYNRAKRTNDAIAASSQAIKIKPDDVLGWYSLGLVYECSGRTNEAIAAYEKAVTVDPHYAEAWYALGGMYRDVGKKNSAVAAFQTARKLKPELFK
jgi:tetratricopeptide (TPR) repeat protein